MNPEIKKQWNAALTSGEYEQGKQRLRTDDDKYCCLGVLCNLAVKAGVAKWERRTPTDYSTGISGWHCVSIDGTASNATTLPYFVQEWAGLEDENPIVSAGVGALQESLAELNDQGIPFDAISELVKEQL